MKVSLYGCSETEIQQIKIAVQRINDILRRYDSVVRHRRMKLIERGKHDAAHKLHNGAFESFILEPDLYAFVERMKELP